MPEHPAARFVQHEISQGLILSDPFALLPDRVAGGRRHAADDDIAHLALGMAGNDVNDLGAAHDVPSCRSAVPWSRLSPKDRARMV